METRAFREELLRSMVSHAADSYKEVVRVAGVLEDKAQKTATVAGAFLAAGLAFVKQENLTGNSPIGSFWTLLPLTLAIVGLIVAVGICLRVLWIREQAAPIDLGLMKEIAVSINAFPDAQLTDEVQDRCRIEVTNQWKSIVERQQAVNLKKATEVRNAQGWLAGSIVMVAFTLLIILLPNLAARVVSAFKG